MDEEHQPPSFSDLPPAVSAGGPATPPVDWLARLLEPAYAAKSWLRFLGVVMIAGGVLAALTLVGLLFAWLYVWIGVLLWQAGDRAEQARRLRDPALLEQFLQKLKTLITIAGVTTALSLALALVALLLALSLGWLALIAGTLGM